jgi:glycosyltransferase involved in cell wall biosynthesis
MRVGIGPFADSPSGMAVASADTALGLAAAGVDVTLFVAGGASPPRDVVGGVDAVVELRPLPRALRNPRVGDAVFLATKLALSRRWAAALEAHPVDGVHTFSPGCLALLPRPLPALTQAWFHPPRIVPRLRTMLPFKSRFPPMFAAHTLLELQSHASDRLGYRRADTIVVNTPTAERGFRERGFDAVCIPPAIQVPEAVPEREPGDALRVVFCAHPLTNPRKGLRELLEALPLVRGGPLELTLVGGGDEAFAEPIERARRAGVRVDCIGLQPRERYLELLARRTDLLAFPSLYEEWGYALLEALSRGVPALAFRVYPFFDVLDADTGILVERAGPEALAGGLEAALRGELPSAERVLDSTRRRFSTGSVVPRLVDAYERALGKVRERAAA